MKITAYKQDIGQAYDDPFKDNNVYPFNKIGRVVVDKDTAEIKHWLGDNNSNLSQAGYPISIDSATEDVMVYFPAFYYKRTWNGDVLEDSILTDIPTTRYREDYEVFPCFVREDGSIRPYILYGAFKGVEIGGQLRSVIGSKPTVSKTISAFRDLARQGRSTKWNIETFQLVSMVQFLYKVAFQNLNSQSVIGNGWTSKSESATTGSTMLLGNRSGYYGVNGDQISLFGIEDFYGNVWSFVDGFLVQDDGYYITNNPSSFGTIASHEKISATPLMSANANEHAEGYFKTIEKISGTHKYANIPNLLGGSASGWYTDYLWSHRRTQTNICLFGAPWSLGSRAGAFCLYLYHVASHSGSDVGARPCVLP